MSSKILFVCVAVVAAVFAFVFFGTHFITKIIDDKIGGIQVNMPRIRVEAPKATATPPTIVFRIGEDEKGRIVVKPDDGQSCKKKQQPKAAIRNFEHPNKIQLHEPFLAVNFDDKSALPGHENVTPQPPQPPYIAEEIISHSGPIVVDTTEPATHPRVLVGCRTDADCNVVNGDGKNVCKSDGTCSCVGGGSGLFCHYGPVNYRDPKDMSPDELRRFKSKFRNNYTLQDYKNWLLLYKNDPENLREQHRLNLRLLLQGANLTPKDVPHMRIRPPTNASDYFQKMYKGGNIAVQFPDNDSPYVGANFREYDEFVPPENVANSWITGVVNAYQDGKDSARALDWYLLPEVTVGEDEQRVGDVYQRYVQKQHNLADVRIISGSNQKGELCAQDRLYRGKNDLSTFDEDGKVLLT
jgi:hypothetical protein